MESSGLVVVDSIADEDDDASRPVDGTQDDDEDMEISFSMIGQEDEPDQEDRAATEDLDEDDRSEVTDRSKDTAEDPKPSLSGDEMEEEEKRGEEEEEEEAATELVDRAEEDGSAAPGDGDADESMVDRPKGEGEVDAAILGSTAEEEEEEEGTGTLRSTVVGETRVVGSTVEEEEGPRVVESTTEEEEGTRNLGSTAGEEGEKLEMVESKVDGGTGTLESTAREEPTEEISGSKVDGESSVSETKEEEGKEPTGPGREGDVEDREEGADGEPETSEGSAPKRPRGKERATGRSGGCKGSADDEDANEDVVGCTSCGKRLRIGRSSIRAHPVLGVVVCKKCFAFYNSGNFSRDENGTDEQCRWCAEGGKLVCCDACPNAFCQSCIRREFGARELSRILKADEWPCFVCDGSPLSDKVALCEKVTAAKKKANGEEGRVKEEEEREEEGEEEDPELLVKLKKWVDEILGSSTAVRQWAKGFKKRLANYNGRKDDGLAAEVGEMVEVVRAMKSDMKLVYKSLRGPDSTKKVKRTPRENGAVKKGKPEENGAGEKGEPEENGVGEKEEPEENGVEEKEEREDDDGAVKEEEEEEEGEIDGEETADGASKVKRAKDEKGEKASKKASGKGEKKGSSAESECSSGNESSFNVLAKQALLKALEESEDSGHSSFGGGTNKVRGSTDDDDTDTSLLRKISPRKTKKTPERPKRKSSTISAAPSSESDRDEVGIGRRRSGSRISSPIVRHDSDPKLSAQVRVVLEKLPLSATTGGKKRRRQVTSSDSDSLGKSVARLVNLNTLDRTPKKSKRERDSKSDERVKKTARTKKKARVVDDSDEVEEDGEGTGSEAEDDGSETSSRPVGKGKEEPCENDLAKATLVKDLDDDDDDDQEDGEDADSTRVASGSGSDAGKKGKGAAKKAKEGKSKCESDGDVPRKKKAVDRLLRVPLDERKKGSDSDASPAKEPKVKKRRRLAVSSDDSDGSAARKTRDSSRSRSPSPSSSSSESESSSGGRKRRGKGKKTRRRRRIINVSSSDGSDGDGSDSDRVDKGDTPSGKGRKNIRKLIKDKKLAMDTKTAAKEEDDRRKRIAELQKLYNVVVEAGVGDHASPVTTKLILEVDPKTNDPVIEVHPKLIRKLKPHQVDGVKFLWASVIETLEHMKDSGGSGCMLAHCMGLGKTLQVITFIHTLLTNPSTEMNTVLVVCPLNTVINWANEFTLWLDNEGLHVDVYEMSGVKNVWKRVDVLQRWQEDGGVLILGYEMFRMLAQEKGKKFTKRQKEVFATSLIDPGADVVVCDEGHVLKNDLTALSKAMNRIRTRRRVVLTGTPLQNNLVEYHCMVNFVKPNLLGNLREFRNRFANPISNGQCADSTIGDVHLMKRRAHILHNLLDGCVQRQDYGVLTPFLPPKQEYVISVRLSEIQIKLYRHYLSNLAHRSRGSGLFADYQNLMKIWTHPMVLKMAEIREMNKVGYGSEDSFIDDDDSSENSEASKKVSDSEDDVVCIGDGVPGSSGLNAAGSKTRSKNPCRSSDEEIINTWKTRSRSQRTAPPEPEPEAPVELGGNAVQGWWTEFIEDKDMQQVAFSGKLVILFYILRECEAIGDKILIFSQSLLSLDLIEEMLRQSSEPDCDSSLTGFAGSWSHGLDYFRMDGSTSADVRNKWTRIFNDPENFRARLFLISTRAGSLGINLVSANRVIIFDASWNPTHDVQSIFRVYRFGQEKPVYVYRLLAQGTMEEKIYDRQVTKQSLACRVVDEKQIERHFNAADLQELYLFNPEVVSKRPIPMVPKDRLLAEMLIRHKEWIVNYHEHDSLLENRPEEVLSEEERKAAWEEYEAVKKGMIMQTTGMVAEQGAGTFGVGATLDVMRIRAAILERDPGISEEELKTRLQAAVLVLRNFEMQNLQSRQQNNLPLTMPRLNFPPASTLQAQLQRGPKT